MQVIQMEVNKKENGAYVPVGSVALYFPLLSELGISIEPTGFEKAKDKDGKDTAIDSPYPIYADEKVQWVFDACFAATKATARNKLVPSTVQLKEGLSIASTVEELIAEAGGRNGEALANRREAIKALVAFVPTTGKSAAVAGWVAEQLKNLGGIQYQSEKRRQLLGDLVEAFATSLDEVQATKFSRFLLSLNEACVTAEAADDLPM